MQIHRNYDCKHEDHNFGRRIIVGRRSLVRDGRWPRSPVPIFTHSLEVVGCGGETQLQVEKKNLVF